MLCNVASGQSTVLLLEREDAVTGWRALMGPTDPEEAREQAPGSYVYNVIMIIITMVYFNVFCTRSGMDPGVLIASHGHCSGCDPSSLPGPRATFMRSGIHGTRSARKLAVVSKAHVLELGRFSTRNNFHRQVLRFTKKRSMLTCFDRKNFPSENCSTSAK
jgi:hypothetical protein